jgi:hypothetical protein
MLSPVIKSHIEEKLGKEIRYHSDLEYLCAKIEEETKQRIGLNTLKRLFGFINDIREPRLYTLDTIAIYLGYRNWDVYLSSLTQTGNSHFNNLQEINIETLELESVVEFGYEPDRIVRLQYEGNKIFIVIFSQNSKLSVNDKVEITHFVLHYPLIALDVERDGISLGRFTAGKIGGITSLKLL